MWLQLLSVFGAVGAGGVLVARSQSIKYTFFVLQTRTLASIAARCATNSSSLTQWPTTRVWSRARSNSTKSLPWLWRFLKVKYCAWPEGAVANWNICTSDPTQNILQSRRVFNRLYEMAAVGRNISDWRHAKYTKLYQGILFFRPPARPLVLGTLFWWETKKATTAPLQGERKTVSQHTCYNWWSPWLSSIAIPGGACNEGFPSLKPFQYNAWL